MVTSKTGYGFLIVFVGLWGCSSDSKPGGNGDPKGDAGSDGDAQMPLDAGRTDGAAGDAMSMPPDPCDALSCTPGQRCMLDGASARCQDQTCSDLRCAERERCEPHPMGGNVCEDASCSADVDCADDLHCQDNVCRDDVCTAGVRHCDGSMVFECSGNGGQDAMRFSCDNASYFDSQCTTTTGGPTTCSCEDDWDCPAFTVCETGRCEGTGIAPSCSLPAIPFTDTPPAVELHWGGASFDNSNAHDGTPAANAAPWPAFSQVVNTPVVANLDDDNGDGLINELDFAEILFVSHKGNNPWANGVVRAIRGGGPNKGADYFARCGASKLWTAGMPAPAACADGDPDADSGAPVAVGDLDNDGFPEIVYVTEGSLLRILDNVGGLLYSLPAAFALNGNGDAPSIANLDFKDYAEIIIGNIVYVLGDDGLGGIRVTHILTGAGPIGTNELDSPIATMSCAADVIKSIPGLEIAAGAGLYRMPESLAACSTPPCAATLEPVWNATTVTGNSGITGEGYCAIADVWGGDKTMPPGPNNRPDGKPEVILIDNGDLTILDGETGVIIDDRSLGGGERGGAPNVDDFDGDGFMEVASALKDFYVVIDLQTSTGTGGSCPNWPAVINRKNAANGAHNANPARAPGGNCSTDNQCDPAAVCNRAIGRCVCLHNGWKRDSDDDSSRATSSSVFDFNGDGAAEAIYNDECDFRVYEGTTGEILFSQVSRSRTGIENPVVADVDNDGNAEVVTGMNTAEANRCDDDPMVDPPGDSPISVTSITR